MLFVTRPTSSLVSPLWDRRLTIWRGGGRESLALTGARCTQEWSTQIPMEKTLPAGRFFGAVSSFASLGGFQVSELVYEPSVVLPNHAHERANFCYVLQGSYEEVCGRRSQRHATTSVVFHPAGQTHSDRHDPVPVRLLSVELAPERLEQLGRRSDLLRSPSASTSGNAVHLCWQLHRESRQPDDASALAMEGLVLEILAVCSREKSRANEPSRSGWMRQAEELLRARCSGPVNLGQLASEVGVHPVHLARTFRSVYRCSPGEYVRRLRVEAACWHLRTSSLPICEVALLTGFSDQSHLTRTFRRLTGVTPREFRRRAA